MAAQGYVAPIAAGKTPAWKAFNEQLNGPRRKDFEQECRKAGMTHLTAWLQQIPTGDLAMLYFEGKEPAKVMAHFAAATGPFATWFKQQVKEIYVLEVSQIAAMPTPAAGIDLKL